MLARSGAQVEHVRPDPAGARLAGGGDDLGELLGAVGEPGEDRRHPDRGMDACLDQPGERTQPLTGRRRPRLGAAPDLLVERRHREGDRDLGPGGGLGEEVEVTDDERPPCDQPERVSGVP